MPNSTPHSRETGKLAVSRLRDVVTPLSECQAVSTSMVTGTRLVMMS